MHYANAPDIGRRQYIFCVASGTTFLVNFRSKPPENRRNPPFPFRTRRQNCSSSAWLSILRDCFTAPVWKHVLVLVAGAVLAPGKRTVSQVLRVMGLAARPGFARYHEVLNRARWDARAVARRLFAQALDVFLPAGEVSGRTLSGIFPGQGRRGRFPVAGRGRDRRRDGRSRLPSSSRACRAPC